MQRFSEGHIVAHLHIAEIECMPPDDEQARGHTTQGAAVRSPAPTNNNSEAGHHLRVQSKSTGRTPSTTGLLEPSSSESDLLEEPTGLNTDLSNQQESTNCSCDVETEGEEKLSNGCVQSDEVLSRKEHDSKQVNGCSNRSSNSSDFLGMANH